MCFPTLSFDVPITPKCSRLKSAEIAVRLFAVVMAGVRYRLLEEELVRLALVLSIFVSNNFLKFLKGEDCNNGKIDTKI